MKFLRRFSTGSRKGNDGRSESEEIFDDDTDASTRPAHHKSEIKKAGTPTTAVGRSSRGEDDVVGASPNKDENSYSKYGIHAPPEGHQSLKEAKNQIKADGFGTYLWQKNIGSDKTKALVFLYGRGFGEGMTTVERKSKVKGLLQNPVAIERLMRVVDAGGDKDLTESHLSLYIDTSVALKRYFEQDGAFGFIPHMEDAKYYFRIQESGKSFLHAPCILSSYVFQKHAFQIGPVDISKFVGEAFSDDELAKYITDEDGGNSQSVLETILEPALGEERIIFKLASRDISEANLMGEMAVHGPGLVHGFKVSKNTIYKMGNAEGKIGYVQFSGGHDSRGEFVELAGGGAAEDPSSKQSVEVNLNAYLSSVSVASSESQGSPREGAPTSGSGHYSEEENHAMVLIGGRRDKQGREYLLLQNWSEDMQLVEVDEQYFRESGAQLCFVSEESFQGVNEVDLDACYAMNDYLVAEANNLDRPDIAFGGCFDRRPSEPPL